jgi:regulator of sigma E protease
MDSLMHIGLLALMSWEDFLWWLQVVPMVAIGLGAVIFVHELGHFLVAKACGVKCEKFMIGFDIGGYKIARRWGETLYGIGILPLGGYVKMLGQDDDPAHIAEQMQKSQIDAQSANAKAIKGPNGETYYVDRRSYLAKSVPQRMAIISAGVIMNIIFAFIFAVIAYGMGVKYLPSIIGETVPGSPAWRAGLEPGDEIVKLGDRENPTFMQLMGGVTLGDKENGMPCRVRRAASGEVDPMTLKPVQQSGRLAMIGVSGPQSLDLADDPPTIDNSPAGEARLVSPTATELKKLGLGGPMLQSGDKIVAVNGEPVKSYREFAALVAREPDKLLEITIERPMGKGEKNGDIELAGDTQPMQLTFEVPPRRLRDLGLVMKMRPISAIQVGSPAATAGLKVGDVIDLVDGHSAGEVGGWTPTTLPELLRQAAEQQREVELVVLRGSKGDASPERVTMRIKPRVPRMYYSGASPGTPQGVEALGIAYQITNEVQAVAPEGPAARSGIKPGDRVEKAEILYPQDKNGKDVKPLELDFNDEPFSWTTLESAVQFAAPGSTVKLTMEGNGKADVREVSIKPAPIEGAYYAPRGFVFEPIKRTRKAMTFAEQVRYGWDETWDSLTMVVRFLRKLGTQVPATMLGGPGTIAAAAGHHASEGLASLLIFLTMLSANLAVINFLPIPLLDGGHMVFLAYEGLRGRPANERVVIALHTAGFLFIISLMLFVIGLDIQRWLFT